MLKRLFSKKKAVPFAGLLPPGQVLSAPHERFPYSYDASNWRGEPSCVLIPRDSAELAACVRACRREGRRFIARGAGTNLSGATVAPDGEVVISLTRLNRVLELDPLRRRALVECGVVNLDLQKAASAHGLFFAPDPASQKASTLGGNLAVNSGGPRCLKYGITTHHVMAVEIIRPDGSLAWLGDPLGEAAGPDLRGLLVGSEGTLGIISRAWVKLLPLPKAARTALFSFPGVAEAVRAVSEIIARGIVPSTLELMDAFILKAVEQFHHAGYPQDAAAVLLAEVEGEEEDLGEMMGEVLEAARRHGCLSFQAAEDGESRARLWEGRRGAHAAVACLRPSVWVEDGTVPRNRLAEALERLQEIGRKEAIQVGYLFHAGDGNFHPLMLFDDRIPEEREKVRRAGGEMLKACVDLGGTITGEHGVGIDKLPYMEYLHDPVTLAVMGEVKAVLDPENLCNPGKLIPPAFLSGAAGLAPSGRPRPQEAREWVPGGLAEAADMIRRARLEGLSVRPGGGGSKAAAPDTGVRLSSRAMNAVLDFDPANLTLSAGAGLGVAEAEALAESRGLELGFAACFPGTATLGGALSCSDSGPWRESRGRLGDSLLGLEAVLPDGRIVSIGRKVVKNVAGLDLGRLWVGSRGGLGLVASLILKLYPKPPAEDLLVAACPDHAQAAAGLEALRSGGLEPAAYCLLSPALAERLGEELGLRPAGSGGMLVLADFRGRLGRSGALRRRAVGALTAGGMEPGFELQGENRRQVWDWLRQYGAGPEGGLLRLWGPAGALREWTNLARDHSLPLACHLGGHEAWLHYPSLDSLGPWLDSAARLGARFSRLKGEGPLRPWWPAGEAGVMARQIKDHFDPGGFFPELPSF